MSEQDSIPSWWINLWPKLQGVLVGFRLFCAFLSPILGCAAILLGVDCLVESQKSAPGGGDPIGNMGIVFVLAACFLSSLLGGVTACLGWGTRLKSWAKAGLGCSLFGGILLVVALSI